MSTLPRFIARGGSVHEQRLPDFLHEKEDPDRVERAGQDATKIWQPRVVELHRVRQPYLLMYHDVFLVHTKLY